MTKYKVQLDLADHRRHELPFNLSDTEWLRNRQAKIADATMTFLRACEAAELPPPRLESNSWVVFPLEGSEFAVKVNFGSYENSVAIYRRNERSLGANHQRFRYEQMQQLIEVIKTILQQYEARDRALGV